MTTTHGGKGTGKLMSRLNSCQSQTNFAPLEKAALDELRETNTPGAAVAVVSGDRIVYVKVGKYVRGLSPKLLWLTVYASASWINPARGNSDRQSMGLQSPAPNTAKA